MKGHRLSDQTARELKKLIAEGGPRSVPPAPSPPGLRNRPDVYVKCTSTTHAGASGVAAECYPGVMLGLSAGDTLASQEELGDCWLTVVTGTTFATPTLDGIYNGNVCGLFDPGSDERPRVLACAGAAGTPGGTITVEEVDGSPSYASISTLRLDQADGFVVTNPAGGVARVDFQPVSQTVNGMVTGGTGTVQDIGGPKVIKALCVGSAYYGIDAGDGNISASSTINAGLYVSSAFDVTAERDCVAGSAGGAGVFRIGGITPMGTPGITATKTVKDGSGANQTVTIQGGIITGWT